MRVVKVPTSVYDKPSDGAFGWVQYEGMDYEEMCWETCREAFHEEEQRRQREYFFSTNKSNKVLSFIEKIENALNLPKRRRATFSKTNKKNIIHIRLGDFWNKNEAARQLFTILLRTGNNTTSRNFWQAAKDSKYLQGDAFYAFQRFMDGNTNYDGEFSGWQRTFAETGVSLVDDGYHRYDLDLTEDEESQMKRALIDMRLTKPKATKRRKQHAGRKRA